LKLLDLEFANSIRRTESSPLTGFIESAGEPQKCNTTALYAMAEAREMIEPGRVSTINGSERLAVQTQVSRALEQPVKTAQQYVQRQSVNQVDVPHCRASATHSLMVPSECEESWQQISRSAS
jgi:hypothetical protein